MQSAIGMLCEPKTIIYNALRRTLRPGYTFGPHCHENVEVCMMVEGECDIVVNGETITVRTGEMMTIFSHMIHSFHMRSRRPATFLQIHFQPDGFCDAEAEVTKQVTFLHYMVEEHSAYLLQPFSDRLYSCVNRICLEKSDKESPYCETLAKIYIYEMVFLLSREISQEYRKIFFVRDPLVIRAIQYINEHIEERVGPSDVAQGCGANPRHLSSSFREALNITLIDYINIAKVDKAMRWLTGTGMSIVDIAAKLGFSSTQYFSTVFKRYTHVTPREYKLMAEKDV